ncbi:MAG TPA: tripartite tricarboxylate transporter permease, partial [Pseudothermotoga sp.]
AMELPAINEKSKLNIREGLISMWKHKFTIIRGALVGTFIGALPGAGADIAAWVSYGIEKNTSRDPEIGKGSLRGVIAPTSANNAAIGGTWIPALVFGIPGDSITAIVLGAMLMYGLKPGPLIFTESRDLVHQLFAVAILVQILLIPIGWLGIKAFSLFLKLKSGIVLTSVVFFSIIGSYAMRNSFFDVYIMLVFGLIGYIFEKLEIPLAPMILGLILGRMIEDNLRVGLIKTKGSFIPFLTRPIFLVLFLLIIFTLVGPWLFSLFKKSVSR